MAVKFSLTRVKNSAPLAADWLALETRNTHSFFQSWVWTGCLFAERFDDPILLTCDEDGAPIALGLFNRRVNMIGATSLHLGESGVPALDAPYIEHNGLIGAWDTAQISAMLRHARTGTLDGRRPILPRRLVLSGVDGIHLAAVTHVGGTVSVARTHTAPYVDLELLRSTGIEHLPSLSANSRHQLRRSARQFAVRGALAITRATSAALAHDYLDSLAELHQRAWTSRGKPGAFANPFFRRFHHALIDRAPEQVDLLRISAGDHAIGYLHNFRHRGQVLAYQSGFDYANPTSHQKPGLTCHQLAIAMYAAEGAIMYDFLAGADRYKQSLANAATTLHWLSITPDLSEIMRRN